MPSSLEDFEKRLSKKYSRKIVILRQDMTDKFVALAVHVAAKGINRGYSMEKIVDRMVEACTRAKGHSHWHCITGRRFGFNVHHDKDYLLEFTVDNHSFLLFRTKEMCEKDEES